jgi:hypothetical protein
MNPPHAGPTLCACIAEVEDASRWKRWLGFRDCMMYFDIYYVIYLFDVACNDFACHFKISLKFQSLMALKVYYSI